MSLKSHSAGDLSTSMSSNLVCGRQDTLAKVSKAGLHRELCILDSRRPRSGRQKKSTRARYSKKKSEEASVDRNKGKGTAGKNNLRRKSKKGDRRRAATSPPDDTAHLRETKNHSIRKLVAAASAADETLNLEQWSCSFDFTDTDPDDALRVSPESVSSSIHPVKDVHWQHHPFGNEVEDFPSRYSHVAGVIGETMMVFGGADRRTKAALNDVWVYSLETHEWSGPISCRGSPPAPRFCHTGTVVNESLVVFGGHCPGAAQVNDVHVLNMETRTWNQPAVYGDSRPRPRSHHCAARFGDYLLVFGGLSGVERLNDVWLLNISTWQWTATHTSGTPPRGRVSASIQIFGDVLIVFGGYDGKRRLDDLHFLHLGTWRWTQPLERGVGPCRRYGHASVLCGSKLLVYGGNDGTPSSSALSKYLTSISVLNLGATSAVCALLYLTLGISVWIRLKTRSGFTTLLTSTTDTLRWTTLQEDDELGPISGHSFHTMCLYDSQGRVVVFGGDFTTDVWVLDTTEHPLFVDVSFVNAKTHLMRLKKRWKEELQVFYDTMLKPDPSSLGTALNKSAGRSNRGPGRSLSSDMVAGLPAGAETCTSPRPSRPALDELCPVSQERVLDTMSEITATLMSQYRALMGERQHFSHQVSVQERSLRRARQLLDREKDMMAVSALEQLSKVALNIGGMHYETSVHTLTKDGESMLAALFSGRHEVNRDEDGSVFIDRDGTHFCYILNYLRDGVALYPNDKLVQQQLLREAEFYQLPGLAKALKKSINRWNLVPLGC